MVGGPIIVVDGDWLSLRPGNGLASGRHWAHPDQPRSFLRILGPYCAPVRANDRRMRDARTTNVGRPRTQEMAAGNDSRRPASDQRGQSESAGRRRKPRDSMALRVLGAAAPVTTHVLDPAKPEADVSGHPVAAFVSHRYLHGWRHVALDGGKGYISLGVGREPSRRPCCWSCHAHTSSTLKPARLVFQHRRAVCVSGPHLTL